MWGCTHTFSGGCTLQWTCNRLGRICPMKRAHILVVDGQPDAAQQYRAALAELESADLDVVASRDEALSKLRSGSFDLLVADLDNRLVGGASFLTAVREIDGELPMIVVTGHPALEAATTCMRLGAGDYLTKPLDSASVVAAARRLLGS